MAMCFPFKPDLSVGERWETVDADGKQRVLSLKRPDQATECGRHYPLSERVNSRAQ
jgi:hypothetical protein